MDIQTLERLAAPEIPALEAQLSKMFERHSVLSPQSNEIVRDYAKTLKHHHLLTYAHSLRTSLKTFEVLEFIRMRVNKGNLTGIPISQELAEQASKLPRTGLYGGFLHDIGKTGIPTEILDKGYVEGEYSPKDHAIMKQHSEMGYDLLTRDQDTKLLMSAWIALTHHRHQVDPYPNELPSRPREFSLLTHTLMDFTSRIVAIADRYDSLQRKTISGRHMNKKEACQYLGRRNPSDGELIEVLYENKIFQ